MNIRIVPLIPLILALDLFSGAAHAAPVSGQGTWESTLQGRDLDGNTTTFEAYYDTDLDITWLADAYASGRRRWESANTWAANLSIVDAVNGITYDNWRLPSVVDTGTPGCNFAYTGTDCGFNVDTATGEMAHLYYDELGNEARYSTAGVSKPGPGPYLSNTGPFIDLQPYEYWSGTEYAPEPGRKWAFSFDGGQQFKGNSGGFYYALAVSPGDVGAVPEAQTYALMLAGLGLIAWRARRRG